MKKKIFYFFLLIPVFIHAQSTNDKAIKSAENLVHEISKIISANSLFRDSIDWDKLSTDEKSIAFTANDSTNKVLIFDFFTKLLRSAGDIHSFFLTSREATAVKERTVIPEPAAAYLGDNIGLIKVPYCFNLDNNKDRDFANTIKNEIKKIDTGYSIYNWIVDLRQNFGGNMWPMLGGLNALIDDGTVGYFVSSSEKLSAWSSKNGRINFPMRNMDAYKIKQPAVKIAVLLDSFTASSGEMTAISFIGLPNVKTFGQPTAGLTTANKSFALSDGTDLVLATTCVADRNRKKYYGKIIPDVVINPDRSQQDETLDAAKKWILNTENK